MTLHGERFAAAICSEIGIIPFGAGNATMILAPSNDSALDSFGINTLGDQAARMRALETGAYVLRSTKGGISSVIDSYGRTLASAHDSNEVLVVDIP